MNLNANNEWDAEGRPIVNCPRVETVVIVIVDQSAEGALPNFGIARKGDQLVLRESGVNIAEWTPSEYPQGTGKVADGVRRLARLGQNNVFRAHSLSIISDDPTIGAGGIFFNNFDDTPMPANWPVHAVGGAGLPFPQNFIQINFACTSGNPFPGPGGSTYPLFLQTLPSETVSQFAARLSAAILADPVLKAAKIGSQYPSNPNGTNLAVTFDGRAPPLGSPLPIVMSCPVNSTRIQKVTFVQQPGNILDAAPVLVVGRVVPGRTPQSGDNIGQIWFGGMTNTGYGPTGYGGWNATIRDATPATLSGQIDAMVRWGNAQVPSNLRAVYSLGDGMVMWSVQATKPAFPGFGKIAVPPSGGVV